MTVRYQIFVSSTYVDLKLEREQVIRAILEMGHIPVGMEMFSAADESQWKVIARTIANCDYYVVIVAHRYGSMDRRISFTEKEYNFATKAAIPTLAFVIDDSAPWPKDRMEEDNGKRHALKAFKDKVKKKLITIWSSPEDLYARAPIALMKQMTISPRPGWVRATEAVGPSVTNELSRLSSENAELRSQLQTAMASATLSRDPRSAAWMDFFDKCHDLQGAYEKSSGFFGGPTSLDAQSEQIHQHREVIKALGRLSMLPVTVDSSLIEEARSLTTGMEAGNAGDSEIEQFRQRVVEHSRRTEECLSLASTRARRTSQPDRSANLRRPNHGHRPKA